MSEVLCGENILIWRENILAKSNIIELEWDSLLIPEVLSSEEEKIIQQLLLNIFRIY